MRKKTTVIVALLIVITLVGFIRLCRSIIFETSVLGPTRLFELKVVDRYDRIIPGVTVEVKWKANGHERQAREHVERQADGSFSIKVNTIGTNAPPQKADSFVLYIYRTGYKEQGKEFALEMLDGNYYMHTQDDARVYRLPDFVLEEYIE